MEGGFCMSRVVLAGLHAPGLACLLTKGERSTC